ncbi:MAG: c(7)-type cytochrome triheme domain-containing protein [Thermodesulfobacteriota bacterium]
MIVPQLISDARAEEPGSPGQGYYKLMPPSWYGSIVMNKGIKAGDDVAPVVFKHWMHRRFYTCNVCHGSMGFAWKAGETDAGHVEIDNGKKCGACHNGDQAFGRQECKRCHSYGLKVAENSKHEFALKGLPHNDFGNKVDWVKALDEEAISPANSIDGKRTLKSIDKDIVLPAYSPARYAPVPPDVLFPHKAHTERLECAVCHPKPFKEKEGGNPEMDMMKILKGEYCGVCHGKVAFPVEDCFRCHSQPQIIPDWITGEDVAKDKAAAEARKKAREEERKKKMKKKKQRRRTLF